VWALPFVLWALSRVRRGLGPSRLMQGLQLSTSVLLLLIGAVDRECQRFLGMHMTLDWVTTYGSVHRTPGVIWETLRQDLGGAWSSLYALGACFAFAPGAFWVAKRVSYPVRLAQPRWYASLAFLCLLWPTVLWNWVPGGKQRQAKVKPAMLLVWRELTRPKLTLPPQQDLDEAIAFFQKGWQARDTTGLWSFADPGYPLHKRYAGTQPEAPAPRPNIIVLSLETFRAKDMRSMNPDLAGVTPTPFLDQLASQPNSAYYPRYYTSGVPTVYAFMAIHTSLVPHPRRGIHSEATTQHIEGFPGVLKAHGYRTLHFTGSDPDWDSQRVWLNRWYDEVDFNPADGERDRATFRRAAARLREVGRDTRPFFAYLASISNHTPFKSPEPRLDVTPGSSARERLQNTMRYTDDVVRELYESLRGEPWFANTIWIITGDHAFDLGDRGEAGGHENLRHETTWVPLIVHGNDARLPRGAQDGVASHLDLAPTISELANVWAPNSYMGHSLLHRDPARATAVVVRGDFYAYETRDFSVYKPRDGKAFVYAGSDREQRHELASAPAELLAEAEQMAQVHNLLITYLVDSDHVSPRPPRQRTASLQH
jgi:arylsulfatase A-like enzyme